MSADSGATKSGDGDGARRRLMRAAAQLIAESGSTETTVQKVASVAGVSTKTFYQHFVDKDAFFYEFWSDILDRIAVRIGGRISNEADVVERLRIFVVDLFGPDAVPAARGAAMYHSRLSETAPATIAPAHRPLYELLVRVIDDAMAADAVRVTDARRAAGPLLELISASARAYHTGSAVAPSALGPEEVFEFCARALGVDEPHLRPPASSTRR